MDKEIALLRGGASGGQAKPADDLIRRAIATFKAQPDVVDFRQARLLCFGITLRWNDSSRYCLIEDAKCFPRLLDGAGVFVGQPRAFRRCFQGLMLGYFAYDPEAEGSAAAGRQNWGLLKSFLRSSYLRIQGTGMLPSWVVAIEDHDNLLQDDPCTRYAPALLAGNHAEFDAIKDKLGISDSSWLTRQLILAQIKAAVALPDSGFLKHIPTLLDLLDAYPHHTNSGLTAILNRYARTQPLDLNPELRDFSVARWGNPVLAANKMSWSLVAESTRNMVADWLKLYLIHQFFSLLAQDGQNDTRRLKFWQRYYKHIEGVHFALGGYAFNHSGADYVRIRKEAAGQILHLSGGSPSNNAFIMTFRNHVVVEFGETGNACYLFKRDRLPFPLSGSVTGDGDGLKHASRPWKGSHIDGSRQGDWEVTFERELFPYLACRPGSANDLPVGAGIKTNRQATRPATRQLLRPVATDLYATASAASIVQPFAPDAYQSGAELAQWCAEHGYRVVDQRKDGGNLRVLGSRFSPEQASWLRARGFTFSEGRGWWRK
jgi:hypothetical protein